MNKKVFVLDFQARDKSNVTVAVETEVCRDGVVRGRMRNSMLCTTFLGTNCVQKFNSLIDIVESTILIHACQGINVASPAYIEGVKVAYEMCCSRSF